MTARPTELRKGQRWMIGDRPMVIDSIDANGRVRAWIDHGKREGILLRQ